MVRDKLILLIVLTVSMSMHLPTQVFAGSGIRVNEEIKMEDASNPQPDKTEMTTFSFKIRNTNNVCNEDVKIGAPLAKPVIVNDPRASRDGVLAKGKVTFLGFKRRAIEPLSTELNFEVVDETTETVFFDVESGEDSNGCDFQAFEVNVRVCDTGPKCFFCCDHFDGPCEGPTPHTLKYHVDAVKVATPSGTGKISGKVTNNNGVGSHARVLIRKIGTCVPDGPDDENTFRQELSTNRITDRGSYSAENLPFGNYDVTARKDGTKQQKSIVLNSVTPQVDVNFTLP